MRRPMVDSKGRAVSWTFNEVRRLFSILLPDTWRTNQIRKL